MSTSDIQLKQVKHFDDMNGEKIEPMTQTSVPVESDDPPTFEQAQAYTNRGYIMDNTEAPAQPQMNGKKPVLGEEDDQYEEDSESEDEEYTSSTRHVANARNKIVATL